MAWKGPRVPLLLEVCSSPLLCCLNERDQMGLEEVYYILQVIFYH